MGMSNKCAIEAGENPFHQSACTDFLKGLDQYALWGCEGNRVAPKAERHGLGAGFESAKFFNT